MKNEYKNGRIREGIEKISTEEDNKLENSKRIWKWIENRMKELIENNWRTWRRKVDETLGNDKRLNWMQEFGNKRNNLMKRIKKIKR